MNTSATGPLPLRPYTLLLWLESSSGLGLRGCPDGEEIEVNPVSFSLCLIYWDTKEDKLYNS